MKTIFTISRIFTESICMDILQQVNWTELFPLIALLSFLFGINVAVNVAMQLLENLCWTQTATVCSLLLLSGFGFSSARLLVDAPAPPVSAVHLFNISSQSCRVKKPKKRKKADSSTQSWIWLSQLPCSLFELLQPTHPELMCASKLARGDLCL